jgi:hypothetical protein
MRCNNPQCLCEYPDYLAACPKCDRDNDDEDSFVSLGLFTDDAEEDSHE